MQKNTIFQQVLKLVNRHDFNRILKNYRNDKGVRTLSSWEHFMLLLYTQAKQLKSLRDITTSLKSHWTRLYHAGLKVIPKSTLADANNKRDCRLYEELFYNFYRKCHQMAPGHKFRFRNPFYSIDSTTIDLCLSLFPWAKFRKQKGGIKLHTLLNHSGYLPEFIKISNANVHDVKAIKGIHARFSKLPKGSIIAMDRGFVDFSLLYSLTAKGLFFITRAKKNMSYKVVKRLPKGKGILFDHVIRLTGLSKCKDYPEDLRLVKYRCGETGNLYCFLTNNFDLSAQTIANGYKERWQVELFFRTIKQQLRVKTFIGTSRNAVLSQIWTAMIYYLLVSFLKFSNRCSHSFLTLTRILKEVLLDRADLMDFLRFKPPKEIQNESFQLRFL